eukprot:256340_1
MPRKLSQIRQKFKRHSKALLIMVLFNTVGYHLVKSISSYYLFRIIHVMALLVVQYFELHHEILYENYKINTEYDNENHYTPHKEALAATTIPYCFATKTKGGAPFEAYKIFIDLWHGQSEKSDFMEISEKKKFYKFRLK